ncbi:MAG: 16S rRNA (cytidine(1402)-2'-O)-methyltransferase [Patescibacteria group bacterium]|nr:16S rRNA (cytidine(1402)-2'-O)-methyltransferase [Patescibacteria group bacterium]
MATLYIVGTPIGNLEDISLRALRILGEVDFILCEDTRVTGKLLSHYNIKTPTISYHEHSSENKVERIIEMLAAGKNLALVSDAGTPGISDPGGKLIQAILEKLDGAVGIESVPGPSAVTASLSISGMPTDKFIFMGFPPHKKGRQTFIHKIMESEWPVVAYESKHRIIKFLEELKKAAKENKEINKKGELEAKPIDLTSVVVCRELSKMHETVYRGEIERIIEKIKASANDQKGEFVVIVGK